MLDKNKLQIKADEVGGEAADDYGDMGGFSFGMDDEEIGAAFDSMDAFGGDGVEDESDSAAPEGFFAAVQYSGDPEKDMAAELTEVQKKFRASIRGDVDRYAATNDSEYWVSLVFDTREQKNDFLAQLGWSGLGTKYIDGIELAEKLGVALPESPLELKFKMKKEYDGLSYPDDF